MEWKRSLVLSTVILAAAVITSRQVPKGMSYEKFRSDKIEDACTEKANAAAHDYNQLWIATKQNCIQQANTGFLNGPL